MPLSLKYFPDPILNFKCDKVTEFNDELRSQIKEMKKLVIQYKGYALAAPQVGITKRFFVIINHINLPSIDIVINPYIVNPKETIRFKESCLSIPNIMAWNKRIKSFKLVYQNEYGENKEIEVSDLFSVICQHEIDHLDGKLFIDSLDIVERNKIIGKVNKLRK